MRMAPKPGNVKDGLSIGRVKSMLISRVHNKDFDGTSSVTSG
jgi:hypothetical protein